MSDLRLLAVAVKVWEQGDLRGTTRDRLDSVLRAVEPVVREDERDQVIADLSHVIGQQAKAIGETLRHQALADLRTQVEALRVAWRSPAIGSEPIPMVSRDAALALLDGAE